MRYLKFMMSWMLLAFLLACGGGGGSAGTTSGGGSTGNTSTTSTLVVTIVDASGVAVNSISVGGGYTARATLKDASGLPLDAKLVSFSLGDASIATINPSTAKTENGVAEVAIAPTSMSSIGAAALSASSLVNGVTVSGQTVFSVQASSLSLSTLTVGSASLASGSNTPVQTTAQVSGLSSTAMSVNVSFSVSCGRINGMDTGSGGVSVTTNGNGVASAVYDAVSASGSLCSGAVTITASSAGATPKSTVINVAAPSANALVFVSAAPAQIFVSGSGAVDQSIVRFSVLSSAGTAMSNVPVKFSIVTNPGGVGLGATGSVAATTATTSATGEASVPVFSGTIPGPVKVRAELVSNSAVFAESQNLTVASGPPSQRFMSFSVETFNIEGWAIDGTSTQLTARIADRQGNAVEDGTVVNFTAEGGQVARSCATARVNGISQCSVTFQSQNPRPAGGRSSVLAYLEGTKDYVDVNGNNRYDAGVDTLLNLGDAYRDDNESGVYDTASGEFLIPRGGVQACSSAGEPFPARANTCDSNLSTTVRQQAVILFSSSAPKLVISALNTGAISFTLSSIDNPLLPMPAGTIVSAEAVDRTENDKACTIASQPSSSPIPNVRPGTDPNADLSTSHGLLLKDCYPSDQVIVRVKAPSGLTTVFSFNLP